MKYCEAKTVDERWTHAVRLAPTSLSYHTTMAGTPRYGKQPKPELGKTEVSLPLINQLPDDVLCYIFMLYCREKTDTVHLPFNRSNVPPQITISHVCSVWRDVILNIPSIWNDFEVFMDHAKDGDMLINIVHDWLFRSKSMPCSLTLDFKVDDGTYGAVSQERWYSSIVKRLISQFQFRKLSTPFSSTHWTQFLQLPAENLSCIEDLHICCINPPSISNFGGQAPLDGFKKLTTLTSLRMNQIQRRAFYHMTYSEDPVFAHIPWHQLCHIHLNIPTSVLHCFTILRGSSMVLETCTVVVTDCYGPWADIQSLYTVPLYCPQLRKLELGARLHSNQFHFPPILDPILLWTRMPNLKTLAIGSSESGGQYRDIISPSTLVAMRDGSDMELKEFTFYQRDRPMDVGHLLMTFPSLKRVEVLGCARFYNNDMIGFTQSRLIGPCLKELIINWDYNLGGLLQMVKDRTIVGKLIDRDEWQVANKPTSFRYVKIYRHPWSWDIEHKETIEEINRYGVKLIVEPFDLYKVIGGRSHFYW